MHHGVRPGDVLADRYLLVDLLTESGGGRFWRAHDRVLARHVALHVIGSDDRRAPALLDAARRSATVGDRRMLRVLDAEERDGLTFVVNEWGSGRSLDIILATEGPMSPRRAAWVVREAAAGIATAHAAGVPHGHLLPENLLVDRTGAVRLIGFAVDAALRGLDATVAADVRGLAALLYAALTGRWPGPPPSQVEEAPHDGLAVLRPRQVRAGIPRSLDTLCDEVLNPVGTHLGGSHDAARLAAALADVVGDDTGMAAAEAARHRTAMDSHPPAPPPPAWPDAPTPRHASAGPAGPAGMAGAAAASAASAAGVAGGDDTVVAGSPVRAAVDTPSAPAASLLAEPEAEPHVEPDDEPHDEPHVEPEPEAAPDVEVRAEADRRDEPASAPQALAAPEAGAPTEAGLPIFDEETGEVDWLRHHTETPEPPPPFEEPPERPLFAPGDPDESRTQRGRQEESSRVSASGFWPWDTGTGAPGGPAGPVPVVEEEPEDGHVPGRRWLVLAVALILVVLVAVGGLVAWTAGRDGDLLGSADDPSPPQTPAQEGPAEPLRITGVTDLDPQGDPPEEYPDLVDLAVDGDPETAWNTNTYTQQFGPEGLKTGLGLRLDLGGFQDVAEVRVLVRGQTGLSAYVADTEPDDVADLTPVAQGSGDGEITLRLDQPDTGRFVVVWLTSLPQVDDGFRAEVAEVRVLG